MTAREQILGKLRNRLGAEKAENRRATAEARIEAREQTAPRPHFAELSGESRLQRFTDEAQKVHAVVERLTSLTDLPSALAEALRSRNLPMAVRMGEEALFADIDFGVVETSVGAGRLDEPATLSKALSASAETGTLCLASGAENPVTLTFLGETHFVVIFASEIESGLEEVWARIRALGVDPRTVNLVTGPSRTADINQTLELGAHGPVSLHIFIIEDQ